jgi:hypothetical protein
MLVAVKFSYLARENFVAPFGSRGREARRAGIFVVRPCQDNKSSARSDIVGETDGICRPDGAGFYFGLWFYKYVAPLALLPVYFVCVCNFERR